MNLIFNFLISNHKKLQITMEILFINLLFEHKNYFFKTII
jgi:hypothetical protein